MKEIVNLNELAELWGFPIEDLREIVMKARKKSCADDTNVEEGLLMQCGNCGESLDRQVSYFRAGKNGTVFCSKICCYAAYEHYYSKKEVDKTIQEQVRKPKKENEQLKAMQKR